MFVDLFASLNRILGLTLPAEDRTTPLHIIKTAPPAVDMYRLTYIGYARTPLRIDVRSLLNARGLIAQIFSPGFENGAGSFGSWHFVVDGQMDRCSGGEPCGRSQPASDVGIFRIERGSLGEHSPVRINHSLLIALFH